MILMVCAIGAFTVNGSASDIWMMLVFGVVGYVFKKLDYPLAPMVLALVLGDRMEDAFRQSMLGSGGNVGCSGTTGCRAPSSRWPWCCCCGP